MRRSPDAAPVPSLAHLTEAEIRLSPELQAIKLLREAGWHWSGFIVGSALEEQFYQLNNLPRQLTAAYAGLDPADPDEDIVEEAEEQALRLIAEHYLLDETVDAFYEALSALPAAVTLRRPDAANGRHATYLRGALLELKHLFQDDWRVEALLDRLALTASLAIDARPVMVTPATQELAADASARASELLGRRVAVWLDQSGALTKVLPA